MTLLDAGAKVLQDANDDLHYRVILERVISAGLWTPTGRTPDRTLNAALTRDIRRNPASRFLHVGRGVFRLRQRTAADTAEREPAHLRPAAQEDRTRKGRRRGRALSFVDAAEAVLREKGEPLHYAALTERALELGLLSTHSRTPAQTMYVAILQDIQRRERSARDQRFARQRRGMFGLAAWVRDRELDHLIGQYNGKVRDRLHEKLMSLPPKHFEGLVAGLMGQMGIEDPQVTPLSADGGIDIRGTLLTVGNVRVPIVVQVKRWKASIGARLVRELRGSLSGHERGLLVTTSDFTRSAREEAERQGATPIDLLPRDGLIDLLVQHRIGVRSRTIEALELDTESLRTPLEEEE